MRGFGLPALFSLGVGTIVGVGWIVAVGGWVLKAGPLGAAAAFACGTGAMTVIAACYGRASSRVPQAGGELALAEKMLGRGWAYATASALILVYLGAIVFEAAALGWLLAETGGSLGLALSPAFIAAIQLAVIGLLTWINLRGVDAIGGTQTLLTALKIGGFLAMMACGAAFGSRVHLEPLLSTSSESSPLPAIAALGATTPFWFAGFNVLAQATRDRKAGLEPRHVANVMVASVLTAGLLYIGMIFAVSAQLPRVELGALSLPAADAFALAAGQPWLKPAVLLIGMTGILAAWNAMCFAALRVLGAAASRGLAPVRPERSAVWALGLTASAGVGGIALGRGVMDPAIGASAAALSVVFAIVCAAVWRLEVGGGHRRWRLAASFGALISLGMLAMLFGAPLLAGRPPPAEFWIASAWAVFAAGGGAWLHRRTAALAANTSEPA